MAIAMNEDPANVRMDLQTALLKDGYSIVSTAGNENAENISKNLDEMIEMAKYKDYKRFDYLKTRTKEQLRIISEGEQLLIENIF